MSSGGDLVLSDLVPAVLQAIERHPQPTLFFSRELDIITPLLPKLRL